MITTRHLLSGALSVHDYRCDAASDERPYTEVHASDSLSYVHRGSFGYRCRNCTHELVAGSVLVARAGVEYVCTHEHHDGGDECLSFKLDPALVDELGARAALERASVLPPLPELIVLAELAQASADGQHDIGLDEAGLWFAQRFVEVASDRAARGTALRTADRRRAVEAALWIAAHSAEPIELADAARAAGLSAFHFLRLFTKALGMGLIDHLGNLDYVAREVIKAEEVIDYTPRENVAERLAKKFGASIGAGAVKALPSAFTLR